MPEVRLNYQPQPKQVLLHNTTAKQILYGGSAGGGKSHALRWDAIMFAINNPNLQCYLFRKTLTELEDNHIRFLQEEIPSSVASFLANQKLLKFVNGSIIRFCYCERPQDVQKYQGAEIHWLGIDEATHFDPSELIFLRTRVRLGKYQISRGFKDVDKLPRTVYATNPGGPSHSFLKGIFIDNREPMKPFYDASTVDVRDDPENKGWQSIYIPSRIADNKYLDRGYSGSFSALPEERQRALRDGDWDAVVGAALDTLSKTKHMVTYFRPPTPWLKFSVIDWGTQKPFYVGWFTIAGGDLTRRHNTHLLETANNPEREIFIPEGALILYNEWYGWNGRPDQGCRLDSTAVARQILDIERERGDVMDYRVGDSSMWARSDGPTPAERMAEATEGVYDMQPSQKDRKAAYNEMLCRLAGNPRLFSDGRREDHPMFFAMDNCRHFWRTVPILTVDERDPDKGPGQGQEDHCYDCLQYALRSRPFVMTEVDRWEQEYGSEMRQARRMFGGGRGSRNGGIDHYSTG